MRVPKLINIATYVPSCNDETRKLICSSLKKDGIVDLIVKRLGALDPVICNSCENFAKTEPLKYSTINNPKCLKCERAMCSDCWSKDQELWFHSKVVHKIVFHVCSVCEEGIN